MDRWAQSDPLGQMHQLHHLVRLNPQGRSDPLGQMHQLRHLAQLIPLALSDLSLLQSH